MSRRSRRARSPRRLNCSAARRPFDLALLDLNIPGVQGFEGLLQLRTRHPRLPVVVVSGHEEPKIISEALSYGAAGFIPKSVRKGDLADGDPLGDGRRDLRAGKLRRAGGRRR